MLFVKFPIDFFTYYCMMSLPCMCVMHNGLCVQSHLCVCMCVCLCSQCVCDPKKRLFTHLRVKCLCEKDEYCSLIHFICHQVFARSIDSYREHYIGLIYIHTIVSQGLLDLSKHYDKNLAYIVQIIVTPTVWLELETQESQNSPT